MPTVQFKPLSDNALFVQFGTTINEKTQKQIQATILALKKHPFPGLIEIVPSYTNFCIFYDPYIVLKQLPKATTLAERVQNYVQPLVIEQTEIISTPRRVIEISVMYGGEYGPDLQEVANYNRLTTDEVIQLHTSRDYLVYMLGFAPGFPFLGGLDTRLITPRHKTPRLEIAAGSVGIGGEQTGVYPFATPGGWQIIGRTMTPLFSLESDPPTLLQAGDFVRFIAVEGGASC